MNNITYSFIIPHKNCPELLERCVSSIPQRNDVQIIVVDDNSELDKKPTLKRKDVELIYLDGENSNGAGRARNAALRCARGKWILCADADDYYKEGLLTVLDQYKDLDIDLLFFNAGSDCPNSWPNTLTKKLSSYINKYVKDSECIENLKYGLKVPWYRMVSHDLILRNNIKFEEIEKGNDIQYSFLTSYFANNIKVDSSVLYIYTSNPNGISNTKRNLDSWLCSISNVCKINAFYKYTNNNNLCMHTLSPFWWAYKDGGVVLFLKVLAYAMKNICFILGERMKYVRMVSNMSK